MLYLLAIFLPWLSLFFVGKPFQAIFSLILSILSVFAALLFGLGFLLHIGLVIHACIVINGAKADKRTKQIVDALNRRS